MEKQTKLQNKGVDVIAKSGFPAKDKSFVRCSSIKVLSISIKTQ